MEILSAHLTMVSTSMSNSFSNTSTPGVLSTCIIPPYSSYSPRIGTEIGTNEFPGAKLSSDTSMHSGDNPTKTTILSPRQIGNCEKFPLWLKHPMIISCLLIYGIIPLSLAKWCNNPRGLRDSCMPAELPEIHRQDIYKIQRDSSVIFDIHHHSVHTHPSNHESRYRFTQDRKGDRPRFRRTTRPGCGLPCRSCPA